MLTGSFADAHLLLPPALAALAGAVLGCCAAGWSARYAAALARVYGNSAATPAGAGAAGDDAPAAPRRWLLTLLAALLGLLLERRFGLSWALACHLPAAAALLALAVIDARTSLLPDALTLPLLWLGLLAAWAGVGVDLRDAVAGAAAGYGVLFVLNEAFRLLRGREGMGRGDAKLAGALGAWLGWQWLPLVLLAACLAGVAWAACRHGRASLGASYPFGPFLVAAGLAALVAPAVHSYIW